MIVIFFFCVQIKKDGKLTFLMSYHDVEHPLFSVGESKKKKRCFFFCFIFSVMYSTRIRGFNEYQALRSAQLVDSKLICLFKFLMKKNQLYKSCVTFFLL